MRYPTLFLVGLSLSLGCAQQPRKPPEGDAALSWPDVPDFTQTYRMPAQNAEGGMSLVTSQGTRTIRVEGQRCFLEGTFPVLKDESPALQVQVTVTKRARNPNDRSFCGEGQTMPIYFVKKTQSMLGSHLEGSFIWGMYPAVVRLFR